MESFSGKMSFSQHYKDINCLCCGRKNLLSVVVFYSPIVFLSLLNVYVAVVPKDSKQTEDAIALEKKGAPSLA